MVYRQRLVTEAENLPTVARSSQHEAIGGKLNAVGNARLPSQSKTVKYSNVLKSCTAGDCNYERPARRNKVVETGDSTTRGREEVKEKISKLKDEAQSHDKDGATFQSLAKEIENIQAGVESVK